jgi:hypothetical protein
MKARKPTQKAAAVKRKTVIQKSYNVSQFREMLRDAAGPLIALESRLDQMIRDKK